MSTQTAGKTAKAAAKPSKAVAVKKEPKLKFNPKTGVRPGSLGDRIGLAILAHKSEDGVLKAVEEVMATEAKRKGLSTAQDYIRSRSVSWIAFLRDQHEKLYPQPEEEKTSTAIGATK